MPNTNRAASTWRRERRAAALRRDAAGQKNNIEGIGARTVTALTTPIIAPNDVDEKAPKANRRTWRQQGPDRVLAQPKSEPARRARQAMQRIAKLRIGRGQSSQGSPVALFAREDADDERNERRRTPRWPREPSPAPPGSRDRRLRRIGADRREISACWAIGAARSYGRGPMPGRSTRRRPPLRRSAASHRGDRDAPINDREDR